MQLRVWIRSLVLAGAVHLDKVDSFSMRIVGRRGGLGRAEMKRRRDGRREKEQTGGWGLSHFLSSGCNSSGEKSIASAGFSDVAFFAALFVERDGFELLLFVGGRG